jgi:regulator of protease activity HflC (stomatin/prohibitin superfamily)
MYIEIIASLIILLIIIIAFHSIIIVPQGYQYTIEKFGRYTTTLKPGLHIIIPIAERVGAKVSIMEMVLDVPSQDVITRDNAVVTADGVIFYQIFDAAKSAYEVADLKRSILNLTTTNIRTVMGSMDLDELLSNRETINAKLLSVVDDATSPWGTKVARIEIKDITPPRDLVDSMARQMKAEREKRAVILEAEGQRQAQILQAEGEKQAMTLEAEGRKEAAFRDAESRERLAEAEAKATDVVSESIGKGNIQALNYFISQKYVEAFNNLAKSSNQKVIMMPFESSSLIGTLGGMAELLKDTVSTSSAKTPSRK